MLIHWDQMGFITGCRDCSMSQSINLTHHINKLNNENHMIILRDTEKVSDKIQHPFMIKTLNKLDIERAYLNTGYI